METNWGFKNSQGSTIYWEMFARWSDNRRLVRIDFEEELTAI